MSEMHECQGCGKEYPCLFDRDYHYDCDVLCPSCVLEERAQYESLTPASSEDLAEALIKSEVKKYKEERLADILQDLFNLPSYTGEDR